jgi:allophanate hydrolase
MLTVAGLRRNYRAGYTSPVEVVSAVFARVAAEELSPVWISIADREQALERARTVDQSLPLAGVPFAVKDNIDIEGMATTAGCPSFAYTPTRTASVVRRLLEAGAILVGKTNMDQFATGLVGMRSPYGECSSVFDARYIAGGSSSGSAVAVASGLCAFALGTDTAGSGRVPAAFNNLVGLKPTRGLLSTAGVVPACQSLDCLSIFASTVADAELVWRVGRGFDPEDPYSRTCPTGSDAAPWLNGSFRFGLPRPADLEFFDDVETAALYGMAVQRMQDIGGTAVPIEFHPFREAAALLYGGPWVAERFAAVGEFVAGGAPDVHPVVRDIVMAGAAYCAADAYRAAYRLEALKREAQAVWADLDVLLLPTAATIYTREAVRSDPVRLNANLGYYTNFVNLMDLAAVALPAGFRRDGLPFGVSIIGPAFADRALLSLGGRFMNQTTAWSIDTPGCIVVAVVGAHLEGQPLNRQLAELGARLVRTCRTSPQYRLFVLHEAVPIKPALVRDPDYFGAGIEVELWAVPEDRFGGFVAAVPWPLAIGSVQMDDGEWVKGFVCEPAAIQGSSEITRFGGWRAYLNRETVRSS